ncbi:hypothetical protein UlMin_017723, partial [Ulmus minor]
MQEQQSKQTLPTDSLKSYPIRSHQSISRTNNTCFTFVSLKFINPKECFPSLEPAFQRLIFITMLAWENPYCEEHSNASEKPSFQRMLVREDAFICIAPTIPGVADGSTAHNLFKAVAGDGHGISLGNHNKLKNVSTVLKKAFLCIGSSQQQPVLKWENNMAWPGKLTLTDKAIYFESVGILGHKDSMRLDLTRDGLQVEKAKVGPLDSVRFDSAVSISSGLESKPWVLEFVDLGGEMKRDIWHAFISEVIALHKFIRSYGPEDGDESIFNVYGAINSIARLQALQYMIKLLDDPIKLVPFSYLHSAPCGDFVCQTLSMRYWGGLLIKKFVEVDSQPVQEVSPNEVGKNCNHVFDLDGSVYLRKWMKSPSWSSSDSISFWKSSLSRQGVVLSKNLVLVEKTQATIDAAVLKGIPSNIDLFK